MHLSHTGHRCWGHGFHHWCSIPPIAAGGGFHHWWSIPPIAAGALLPSLVHPYRPSLLGAWLPSLADPYRPSLGGIISICIAHPPIAQGAFPYASIPPLLGASFPYAVAHTAHASGGIFPYGAPYHPLVGHISSLVRPCQPLLVVASFPYALVPYRP